MNRFHFIFILHEAKMLPDETQACLMFCLININYMWYYSMKNAKTQREQTQEAEEAYDDGPPSKKKRNYLEHRSAPRFWCQKIN